MKYIFKDEPNSQPFNSILRATIEETDDDDPVRKCFTRILNKSISAHDLSKQGSVLNDAKILHPVSSLGPFRPFGRLRMTQVPLPTPNADVI